MEWTVPGKADPELLCCVVAVLRADEARGRVAAVRVERPLPGLPAVDLNEERIA